jgi:hypothetical protein
VQDVFFDGVLDDESDDGDVARLSDAVGAVFSLFVVVGVERPIKDDYRVCARKIDPKAPLPQVSR